MGHLVDNKGAGKTATKELPVFAFESAEELRAWLIQNHRSSDGIWLRIYKKDSGVVSITFTEVLDEGLCFGWSESMRRRGDATSYLQRFTPRRKKGTTSKRNRAHVQRLITEGKITPFGLEVL